MKGHFSAGTQGSNKQEGSMRRIVLKVLTFLYRQLAKALIKTMEGGT